VSYAVVHCHVLACHDRRLQSGVSHRSWFGHRRGDKPTGPAAAGLMRIRSRTPVGSRPVSVCCWSYLVVGLVLSTLKCHRAPLPVHRCRSLRWFVLGSPAPRHGRKRPRSRACAFCRLRRGRRQRQNGGWRAPPQKPDRRAARRSEQPGDDKPSAEQAKRPTAKEAQPTRLDTGQGGCVKPRLGAARADAASARCRRQHFHRLPRKAAGRQTGR